MSEDASDYELRAVIRNLLGILHSQPTLHLSQFDRLAIMMAVEVVGFDWGETEALGES